MKNVKLNILQLSASSIVALGGLAVGTTNATVAEDLPQQQPVLLSVAADAQGGIEHQLAVIEDAGLVRLASVRPVTPPADVSRSRQVADATNLLGNIRASLGLIAADYAEASKRRPAHKSSALVVATTRQAALELENLEQAIQAKDAKGVSRATRDLSKSMGKLQTTYALIPEKSARADMGMRTASANWSAYRTRYALAKPRKETHNAAEIRDLKSRVKQLTERVSDLERATESNATLHREVVRLRADINRYSRREETYETYQSLLLMLAVVDGVFDAFHLTTRIYYPTFYSYFESCYAERGFWEDYWADYYDGYYASAGWGWYDEGFVVPETLVIAPAPEVVVYQSITYQEIYQTTEETTHLYEALPDEDLTVVEVAAPSEDTYSDLAAVGEMSEGPGEQQDPEPLADAPVHPDADERVPASDSALELHEGESDANHIPMLRSADEPTMDDNGADQPDSERDERGGAPRD